MHNQFPRRTFLALSAAGTAFSAIPGIALPQVAAFEKIATAHLGEIFAKRDRGRPGNYAYCIFEFGGPPFYWQALAKAGSAFVIHEIVSAQSVPEAATMLTSRKKSVLDALGYSPPGDLSPNYRQETLIGSPADLQLLARIAAFALANIYGAENLDAIRTTVHVPQEIPGSGFVCVHGPSNGPIVKPRRETDSEQAM